MKAQKKEFPQDSEKFNAANRYASKLEKKKYPKGYEKLDKIDKKLPSGEILGHINKIGNITISNKVPKRLRGEVSYHENIERSKILEHRKKSR